MNHSKAAVIGAGFGGLALAVRLQAGGVRTTLFEKRDRPGGRAYVYRDEGYTFDAGPTVITDPAALAELSRVCSGAFIASVPFEPIWRVGNLARRRYVRDLGNTPGHLNHWSKASFVRMLARHGEIVAVRSPFPWTMVLVSLG